MKKNKKANFVLVAFLYLIVITLSIFLIIGIKQEKQKIIENNKKVQEQEKIEKETKQKEKQKQEKTKKQKEQENYFQDIKDTKDQAKNSIQELDERSQGYMDLLEQAG